MLTARLIGTKAFCGRPGCGSGPLAEWFEDGPPEDASPAGIVIQSIGGISLWTAGSYRGTRRAPEFDLSPALAQALERMRAERHRGWVVFLEAMRTRHRRAWRGVPPEEPLPQAPRRQRWPRRSDDGRRLEMRCAACGAVQLLPDAAMLTR